MKSVRPSGAMAFALSIAFSCRSAPLLAVVMLFAAPVEAMQCRASWYGGGERLAKHTANGDVFRPSELTAAHRSLRFGTKVRVHYRGRSVVVTINDRGPAAWTGKCIDLSRGAADRLGLRRAGVGSVRIEVLR